MKCVICKNGNSKRQNNRNARTRGSIVVIKGVDAGICNNCGEYYLDQKTTKKCCKKPTKLIKKGLKLR